MRDHADYLAQISLGSHLRSFRINRGMTQTALAKVLGFAHPSSISNIEKGRRPVTDEELTRLARAFKCNVGSLASARGDPKLFQ